MNKFSKIAVLAAIAPLAGFAEEIFSANTFGVMKVVAKKQIVALPVPFGGASASYVSGTGNVAYNTDITLPYMLQMSSLPVGTKAYIYNSASGNRDIYELKTRTVGENQETYWDALESTAVSGDQSNDQNSVEPEDKTIPTGRGFFLEFPSALDSNGQIVYLYGQELTGDAPATEVPANSTALVCPPQTACTVNCTVGVASPTATVLTNNKITTEGDSITVVNGLDASPSTNPTRTYYYIGGGWKYCSNSFADIANPWKAPDNGTITVPAGCAMWYTNKSTESSKTVTWTPVVSE